MYDLIIRVETMVKSGIIHNFKDMTLTINPQKLPKWTFMSLSIPTELYGQLKAYMETICMREAMTCAMVIQDANQEKVNLLQVVQENCRYLTMS